MFFHTPGVQTYARNVVSGLVMWDVGHEAVGGFGDTSGLDTGWNDLRLIGNAIETARDGIALFQLTGGETAERLAVTGNTITIVPGEGNGGSGVGLFSGHGSHDNRISDPLIAHNSVEGTTFGVGIGVASGSSGGDSNTVEGLRMFGNHLDLDPTPLGMGVSAGDGDGPVGYPDSNVMRDVEVSGNAVHAGSGLIVAGGCCGAATGTVEDVRIKRNVVQAAHLRGITVVAAGTGGYSDKASVQNEVADVTVDSNTVDHTLSDPLLGPGSLLWGGIVLVGGQGAQSGQLTGTRVSNNRVDSRFIGIGVVGGTGEDELHASDNQISQLDVEGNLVTGAAANVTPTYPWAKGISFIGGIEDATDNGVSCDQFADNLVAGVPNDFAVKANVGAGASGNTVTLGTCPPPPAVPQPPPDGTTPPPDGTTPPPDGTTPPPDGTTPPPALAEYTRTLSLSYSAKKDKFTGKLASTEAACIAAQKVKLYEKQKGKDPKVGSAETNDKGKYSLKEKNAKAKFYASVKQTSISAGTCLAAKSKTVKVG